MKTLLIFLAIIAIQVIAARFAKQKKETSVKTIKKQSVSPSQTYKQDYEDSYEEFPLEPSHKSDNLRNYSQPEEKERDEFVPQQMVPQQIAPHLNNFQFNINDPAHGIVWAAILYEPRYRVRWKRK